MEYKNSKYTTQSNNIPHIPTLESHNEYSKTKDPIYAQKILGHRDIRTTMLSTQLVNWESDQFHFAVAKTIEEATKLVETGFEYVATFDNIMLFRKRK